MIIDNNYMFNPSRSSFGMGGFSFVPYRGEGILPWVGLLSFFSVKVMTVMTVMTDDSFLGGGKQEK